MVQRDDWGIELFIPTARFVPSAEPEILENSKTVKAMMQLSIKADEIHNSYILSIEIPALH